MSRRFARRRLTLRLVMIPLIIAIALTVGTLISKFNGTPLGRAPDRFEVTATSSVAAPVEISAMASTERATVGRSPAAVDGRADRDAKPIEPWPSRGLPAVSPRARAEVPPRSWDSPAQYLPREKSYTGAGRAFDAVH
jgi:hypothetical protein